MINEVLDFWVTTFTETFQEDTDDALKMKVIKKFPFQDDPIRQAPYLLVGINPDKGMAPEDLQEIGGSAWWVVNLQIKAAPKSQKTVELAYTLVDILAQRITWILRKKSLTLVSANQGSFQLFNRDWFTINAIRPKVYGGEGEWLSYVEFDFIQRIREAGPFPYGAYPGDIP